MSEETNNIIFLVFILRAEKYMPYDATRKKNTKNRLENTIYLPLAFLQIKFQNQINKLYHILFFYAIEEKIILEIFRVSFRPSLDKKAHK